MSKEEDNYLNRRVAFWDNWYRDFECARNSFEAQSAGKFINDNDEAVIKTVNSLLRGVYYACAKRYHKVLGEQLQAFAEGKE